MALTRQQVQDAVDAKLATLWAAIQTKQDAYAAAHGGRYWQGLKTHTVTPADGTETTPDVGTRVPTDQPSVWPSALRNTAMPMAIQIDVYDGVLGPGYTATVFVTVAGTTYSRTANSGPETWRTQPWAQVEPLA